MPRTLLVLPPDLCPKPAYTAITSPVLTRTNFNPPVSLLPSKLRLKDRDELRHSKRSRTPDRVGVCEKECFSVVNIPPEGMRVSCRNCGRPISRSVQEDIEEFGDLRSIEEKFEDMGLGAGGHSVMSVARVTACNFAKDTIVADLVGPECSIMSGRPDRVVDNGSCWMVI